MMRLMAIRAVLAAACVLLGALVAAEPKSVHVSLRAKWEATSLALEAAEFLADEQDNLFWKYLESWSEGGNGTGCDAAIHDRASTGLSTAMTKVMRLALTTRIFSPRVELFRTIAVASSAAITVPSGSCCWAEVGGKAITDASALEAALSAPEQLTASTQRLFSFDHVYPGASEGVPAAVLYGALGSPCTAAFHRILKEFAERKAVAYSFRPYLPPGCGAAAVGCGAAGAGGPLPLGGFGVSMALKNMEYKAIDDSKVAPADASAADGSGGETDFGTEDVHGFLFKRLVERKPELKAELSMFRDTLMSADMEEGDQLAVWEMKDLGIQATQRIAASADPLRHLADLAGNFPSLATSLSKLKVNESVREEVDRNQKRIRAGANALSLNGSPLDLSRIDLFSLIDKVSTEVRLSEALRSLALPASAVRGILRLTEPPSGSVRLIWTDAPTLWLNDIENDPETAKWPTSLRVLLQQRYPGRLPMIRRNLFNAIFVLDVTTRESQEVAQSLLHYLDAGMSTRFGVVPIRSAASPAAAAAGGGGAPEEDPPAVSAPKDEPAAAKKVSVAFEKLSAEYGTKAAMHFLAACAAARGVDTKTGVAGPLSEAAASKALLDSVEAAHKLKHKKPSAKNPDKAVAARVAAADFAAAVSAAEAELAEGAVTELEATGNKWNKAKGIGASSTTAVLLMNGQLYTSEEAHQYGQSLDWLALALTNQETQVLAEAVYYRKVTDDDDVTEFLLRDSGVPTYNARISSPAEPPERLALAGPQLAAQAGPKTLRYLHAPGTDDDTKGVTHWAVADAGTPHGRAVVAAALRFLNATRAEDRSRVAFVYPGGSEPSALAVVVQASAGLGSRRKHIVPFLLSLLSDAPLVDRLAAAPASALPASLLAEAEALAEAAGLRPKALTEALVDGGAARVAAELGAQAQLVTSFMELAEGASAIITNGRVVELTVEHALETAGADFELLEILEWRGRGSAVLEIVNAANLEVEDVDELTSELWSDVAMAAASVAAVRQAAARQYGGGQDILQGLERESAAIVAESADAVVSIEGCLDPLSSEAQKLAPILLVLREQLGSSLALRLALNPARDVGALPIKSYYRYAAPAVPPAAPPAAFFDGLPSTKTLTLGMDVPEMWLVAPAVAAYDLDNLRLEDLGAARGFAAEFELENILVTGHASAADQRQPPRGVQLTLAPAGPRAKAEAPVGTIVMANLGYFQLKAGPGLFTLAIAPGRSLDLYHIDPAAGVRRLSNNRVTSEYLEGLTPEEPHSAVLAVSDFNGKVVRLAVAKRKGMEDEALLEAADDEGGAPGGAAKGKKAKAAKKDGEGLWGRAVSMFSKDKSADAAGAGAGAAGAASPPAADNAPTTEIALAEAKEDNSKIHIFSVASGHLYERFLKIMIQSVLRHTKTPVKFWFISNYMSPKFKEFLPEFAEAYGFDFGLITYKWPTWLNKQTEKQRIIWAYKVLFLDVLFPLSLDRVVFVDADQIVRTDMKELMSLDLKGAPYAYTPMCDNNKEMEGYRFWKQGFWRDHLRGRPYHISALYVVDLIRFRAMAAGDQLRIMYDNLSKDPNSLANLDQDLPNYAQQSVPIYSLPQEWLWCESWCGNATKAAAKTIDLCNNPQTKEPKLEGARRIVSEWVELDEAARAFTAKVEASALAREFEDGGGEVPAARVGEGVASAAAAGKAAGEEGHEEL